MNYLILYTARGRKTEARYIVFVALLLLHVLSKGTIHSQLKYIYLYCDVITTTRLSLSDGVVGKAWANPKSQSPRLPIPFSNPPFVLLVERKTTMSTELLGKQIKVTDVVYNRMRG